jgi:hypothetical protein
MRVDVARRVGRAGGGRGGGGPAAGVRGEQRAERLGRLGDGGGGWGVMRVYVAGGGFVDRLVGVGRRNAGVAAEGPRRGCEDVGERGEPSDRMGSVTVGVGGG